MTLNASTFLLLLLCSAAVLVSGARDRYAAFPVAPNGLMPRYFVDDYVPALVERDGLCGSGLHPCDDIGYPKYCCHNSQYCFIAKDGGAGCCLIGSDCPGTSNCQSDEYQCSITHTLTASESRSSSGTRGQASRTSRLSTSVETACCVRRCPVSSQYQCPSSLGGACCSYGLNCAEGGKCVGVVTAQSGLFTPAASGCTTSQYRCDDGMGCCDNTQSCTDISGIGYCALPSPTQSGTQIEQDGGGGLSSGAKAGIAVSVIVGCGLITLAAAYLFITKRKQRRQRAEAAARGVGPSGPHPQDGSGTGNPEDDGTNTYPGGYGPTMSEITASTRPRAAGPGLTQDYFGPDAVPGPFTQSSIRPGASPALDRAVNLTPQGPGDIAAPVEIGPDGAQSQASTNKYILSPMSNNYILSPTSPPSRYETPPTNAAEGMYELYGSHPAETEASIAESQISQAAGSTISEVLEDADHTRDEKREQGSEGTHD